MKFDSITVGVKLDMQELYDNLIIYRNSIDAQIVSLGSNPSICTHTKTEISAGLTICKHCDRIIDTNGLFDYGVTK